MDSLAWGFAIFAGLVVYIAIAIFAGNHMPPRRIVLTGPDPLRDIVASVRSHPIPWAIGGAVIAVGIVQITVDLLS